MVLTKRNLIDRMSDAVPWERRLVVEPYFDDGPPNGYTASLDFHLGCRFTIQRGGRRAVQHHPITKDSPQEVAPTELFIPMGNEFTLHPGQIVLGTTLEWFRFPFDLMAYVIGRSIWGRRGLLIVTAQAVHPGSTGTITLELSNLGDAGLRFKPGVSIGQLLFHKIDTDLSVPPTIRSSPFTGAVKPILGDYHHTDVERMLLEF
jgi:dCTP deaminase